MAQKLKHQNQGSQGGDNVIALNKCKSEGCKKGTEVTNFCGEHYEWFKWGMLTKEGKRPTDFDKKFTAFMKHKKSAA